MVNAKKKKTSIFVECRHCSNKAPMDIRGSYHLDTTPVIDESDPPRLYDYDQEGYDYELLSCQICKKVTLLETYIPPYGYDDITKILYPSATLRLSGLPSQIQQAYELALKVRVIEPNAYAVLIGRILEMICEDRKAVGKNLYEQLSDLAAKGEIPTKLVGVAHSLRQLRNLGAHASLGELTSEEIPLLDDLCKAILEYVYIAPSLAEKAEARFNTLKNKKLKEAETDF